MLKADDTRYADADLIALTNNGLLYLFSSLKLTLAGQTVEHVNFPGQATSPLGLASYSSTYYKGCGLAQGWFLDIITNAAANYIGFYTRQGYLIRIVQSNDVRKVNLYKSIAANNVIPVSFRMRECERFSLPQDPLYGD